jgi:hypothetical protein
MRNVLVATACGIAFVPASAGAADWYRVGQTDHSVIYTDADGVSREGEDLQVWEYAVIPTATSSGWGLVGAKSRVAIRCQNRSYRTVQIISYFRNGRSNSRLNPDAPRQVAPPGSIVENMVLFHCRQSHRALRLTGITPEDDARRLIR